MARNTKRDAHTRFATNQESLLHLIQAMTCPSCNERPSAESILELMEVKRANATSDSFLSRYITDVERYDLRREKEIEVRESKIIFILLHRIASSLMLPS